jgi:hypothetical protein
MTRSLLSQWLHTSILFSLALLPSNRLLAAQPADPGWTTIVIGFVGGFVHSDATAHEEVRLAARLVKDHLAGVGTEIFPNHLGSQAHAEILRLLDTDHNGTVSAEEKGQARIILYGHSWGASETISMARTLQKEAIPVLLTIQVDSVSKPGSNDGLIPANVAKAVNFYQTDGLLHGRRQILAVDPIRTRILGNFQSGYKDNPVTCQGYPWYARLVMKPHIEMECDPGVWGRVEALIRSEIMASQR